MTDERTIGIPDGHKVHRDFVYASGNVPYMWHRERWKATIDRLHEAGVDGTGVVVSVNDTGSPRNHELLNEDLVSIRKDYTGTRSDAHDDNGHGGHCHGIVAGERGLGLAPGATIQVRKVLNRAGSGSTTGINQARVDAGNDGADLISESLGSSPGNERPEDQRAVDEAYSAGVSLCVAAAGNFGYQGRNTIGPPGSLDNIWTVGATRQNDRIANFSSGGPTIDCASPGENILSVDSDGFVISMSGTSMATPNFVGLMALIIQKRRSLGFAGLQGVDEWREWFVSEKLMIDGGPSGIDPQFGIGIAMVENIFAWLEEKEPVWA